MSLVLLHGFTGHARSWDSVVSALPSHRRVFRPCLLGHDSSVGAAAESFEDEVDRLAAVVRAEGLAGARLAGYSMGGRIALGLLVRHPGLFTSAVLIGTAPGIEEGPARVARREWEECWAQLLERKGMVEFVDAWERLPRFSTQERLPASVRAAHRAIRLGHDPRELARALRVLGSGGMPDWLPALPDIDVPVRLVAGALDDDFVAHARAMADRLPCAEVRVLEACGHDPLLEQPHALATALEEPLEERPPRLDEPDPIP